MIPGVGVGGEKKRPAVFLWSRVSVADIYDAVYVPDIFALV